MKLDLVLITISTKIPKESPFFCPMLKSIGESVYINVLAFYVLHVRYVSYMHF